MANELTKKALEKAFIQLLGEKPLKKITVSDVTSFCGVNRMTFYYHFEDIYSLLDYSLKEEFKNSLNGKYDASNWLEGMANIFNVCYANKNLVLSAYRFNSRGNVELILDPIVYNLVMHVVKEEINGHKVSDDDVIFVANAYKHLLIGVVLDWIKNDMKEDKDVILKKIGIMLNGETEWVLSKFENHN